MSFFLTNNDIKLLFPLIAVIFFIVIIAVSRLWDEEGRSAVNGLISGIAILMSVFFLVSQWDISAIVLGGVFIADNLSRAADFLILGSCLFAAMITMERSDDETVASHRGTYVALLVGAAGMMTAANSGNLIVIFVGIELATLSMMAMSREKSVRSSVEMPVFEALFLIGLFMTGGAAKSVNFFNIKFFMMEGGALSKLFYLGNALILIYLAGVTYRTTVMLERHHGPAQAEWFYITGLRTASMIAAFRFLYVALPKASDKYVVLLAVLAGANVLAGIMMSILNTKRLTPALSAISVIHAGFALFVVAAGGEFGNVSLVVFLYCAMFGGAGAYAVVSMVENLHGREATMADIAGLERKHVLVAALFLFFLLSIGGMPFTAGFTGNVRVALSTMQLGKAAMWTLIVGLFAAASAAARVVLYIYAKKPEVETTGHNEGLFAWGIAVICIVAIVALGIRPTALETLMNFAQNCVIYFE